MVFAPHLPHKFGRIPITRLAKKLDDLIIEKFGNNTIDLLGFSMGGIVANYWLQNLGGCDRTKRFFSIGSPHHGTLTAQFVPSYVLPGIANMKIGSELNNSLNANLDKLKKVQCISFFCCLDLMVFPGWNACLSQGSTKRIGVINHKALIRSKKSVQKIVSEILATT